MTADSRKTTSAPSAIGDTTEGMNIGSLGSLGNAATLTPIAAVPTATVTPTVTGNHRLRKADAGSSGKVAELNKASPAKSNLSRLEAGSSSPTTRRPTARKH